MPTAILIDKKGSIKEIVLKTFVEADLYKKAGFKNNDGFKEVHTWGIDAANKHYQITLYGKVSGRAGQENKYEFPPPVDTTLFFGSCILVNNLSADKQTIDSVSKDEWKILYDHLYGGFEDIGSEDSEDEEDEEDDDGIEKTTTGYAKDGFVVDDGEEDEDLDEETDDEETDDDNESEEEVRPIKKRKAAPVKKKDTKIAKEKKKSTVFDRIVEEPITNDNYMDCTSELEEEEYV